MRQFQTTIRVMVESQLDAGMVVDNRLEASCETPRYLPRLRRRTSHCWTAGEPGGRPKPGQPASAAFRRRRSGNPAAEPASFASWRSA